LGVNEKSAGSMERRRRKKTLMQRVASYSSGAFVRQTRKLNDEEVENTRWKDSRESDIMETLRGKRSVTWRNDSGLLARLYRATMILRPVSSRGS
ncbi:hypothetical protein K0M31_010112, partial [Melipona bicolor]